MEWLLLHYCPHCELLFLSVGFRSSFSEIRTSIDVSNGFLCDSQPARSGNITTFLMSGDRQVSRPYRDSETDFPRVIKSTVHLIEQKAQAVWALNHADCTTTHTPLRGGTYIQAKRRRLTPLPHFYPSSGRRSSIRRSVTRYGQTRRKNSIFP